MSRGPLSLETGSHGARDVAHDEVPPPRRLGEPPSASAVDPGAAAEQILPREEQA
jgi:hypothetical protein